MSIGRVPILDVQPRVLEGAHPAKAVPGEKFPVTATVFLEGHGHVAANVVLSGPRGERGPWTPMHELTPGTDRLGAEVAADAPGDWTFHVEAWADPVADWYHAAEVKIPAGIDVELVFEEGARLFDRAAAAESVLGATGAGTGARTSAGTGTGTGTGIGIGIGIGASAVTGTSAATSVGAIATSTADPDGVASVAGVAGAAASTPAGVSLVTTSPAAVATSPATATATTTAPAPTTTVTATPAPAPTSVPIPVPAPASAPTPAPVPVPDNDDGPAILRAAARFLRTTSVPASARLAEAQEPRVRRALAARPVRELLTSSPRYPLRVDRPRALFSSWYEFFPRSEGALVDPTGATPPVSGTFRTAAERLPGVAAMGFDVVYLPPVHPIGTAYRKGPNNSPVAGPHDVGSPWAIGSPEGGHDSIHPDLGTFADFDAFVERAAGLGLEVALDFALQCSPDHPWVQKHPHWFAQRADGTIAYAENPPKKYQDIYPLAFDAPGALPEIVEESERVLRLWMAHGVRIFRVDNPHTKPVVFWEALLGRIHATDPDVLFLSEAFTRPAMLGTLGRVGFHQSYTYFTWRTGKGELQDYLWELTRETASYVRPNFFVNTPDILHGYLQDGGRPAFKVRAVLAATLSPSWGVYAGYELCENIPARPGGEEYVNSEKYELRPRDWAGEQAAGRSLAPFLGLLNRLRREHTALQELRNLDFHPTDHDAVLCYSKRSGTDLVLAVVNLDPHNTVETSVHLDLPALGLGREDRFTVRDELTGSVFQWGRDNFIRLDPYVQPAHLLTRLP